MNRINQTTLRGPVSFDGRGIHSGASCKITLSPAAADYGIRFIRADLEGSPEIPAGVDILSMQAATRQTVLCAPGNPSASVQTVEHFLAVFHALGIDNAKIEMTGPEPPIFDGSAGIITREVALAGVQEIPHTAACFWEITRPVSFEVPNSSVTYAAWPSESLTITYFLEYSGHPFIGSQSASFRVEPDVFEREIAPARTFALYEEIEPLIAAGLIKGGEIDNAIVVGRDGPMNTQLHWDNELARHKLLDLIGDLYLLGARVRGHIVSHRGGHASNHQFLHYLRKEFSRND